FIACSPCCLLSCHHSITHHIVLRISQSFFQSAHVIAEIAQVIRVPIPSVPVPRKPGIVLRHLFFAKLDRDFLFLTFPQDCQGHICTFCETAHKLRQLVRLGEDLIVQHPKNVV